jgi:hypothetical protein
MEVSGVVLPRNGTADRALPPIAWASALRARERLLFHHLIISFHRTDERGPPGQAGGPSRDSFRPSVRP